MKKKQTPEEVIKVLEDIFTSSGYHLFIENCDINLIDKTFSIIGNIKQDLLNPKGE